MTTASTNTVIAHASDANYRTWIAEVIAQLLAVGLTQTADTGQVDTATVTRPAINTLNAYAIFNFNDTAQATNPIFFKLDFGTGTVATIPQMRITVGRGSDGTGTINGLVMTRVGINAQATALASTVTAYLSRFCYNATEGFLGMTWKFGALSANACHGGFYIYRSKDASGAVTTESTHLIANASTNAGGVTASASNMQVISHLTSTVYNTAPFPTTSWANGIPLALTATLYSGDAQPFPVWQYTPKLGITDQLAVCLISEVALHTTVSVNILGTSHTYLQVGSALGNDTSFGKAYTVGTYGQLMLWE